MCTDRGYDQDVWRRMAGELGLLGMAVPERYGGGFGFLELGIVLQETGRALLCGPFLPTAVLAVGALLEAEDEAARDRWLPAIAAGDLIATLAISGGGAVGTEPAGMPGRRPDVAAGGIPGQRPGARPARTPGQRPGAKPHGMRGRPVQHPPGRRAGGRTWPWRESRTRPRPVAGPSRARRRSSPTATSPTSFWCPHRRAAVCRCSPWPVMRGGSPGACSPHSTPLASSPGSASAPLRPCWSARRAAAAGCVARARPRRRRAGG